MKKNLFLSLVAIFLTGCATYTKSIQLSPQKTAGWQKESPNTYQYECNQGEVKVGPIVLRHESMGNFDFFIPIPTSKEELRKTNEKNVWFYVQFRDSKPIKSCNLSYVSLVDQSSGDRVTPKSSMDIPINGTYKGKYTHGCHYYFDLSKNPEDDYTLYISEEVFHCSINPINFKKEKSFDFRPRELM